jgi:ParB family chromosome partitioning protein
LGITRTSRRDLKAAALKILSREDEPRRDHPVRHFTASEGFRLIPIALVHPDPNQPRKYFDKRSLEDLTASVKEKSVLQPILVRKAAEGDGYIVIAGERRFRAAKAAGLTEVPAFVRTHEDALEVALIENLQRENLTALEEAEALLNLKTARGFTDAQLAHVIGKSRVAVSESLSLNGLPEAIKAECRTSDIASKSTLLQILRAGSPEKIDTTWDAVKRGELTTVRDLRKHTAPATEKRGRPQHYRFEHDPESKPYTVTVTFTKKIASRAELRAALKDALNHLP